MRSKAVILFFLIIITVSGCHWSTQQAGLFVTNNSDYTLTLIHLYDINNPDFPLYFNTAPLSPGENIHYTILETGSYLARYESENHYAEKAFEMTTVGYVDNGVPDVEWIITNSDLILKE